MCDVRQLGDCSSIHGPRSVLSNPEIYVKIWGCGVENVPQARPPAPESCTICLGTPCEMGSVDMIRK
ncbi:hypothetical protein RRG08_064086 [Elysia crispata]|uniref:Uncharacterized protein n=1 Tax=Elysia crispata TaxID=231223 RepID=A0AAE1CXD9_9GAST|nr:hypothetical protein RRG08_064086 [Elysia crispata]